MEKLDSRLNNAPYFHCEKSSNSAPVCQKCETCVLAWKIFCTKEWFQRISELSQRRFLVSILVQLDSLYLLHYFQNMLQTTGGKDFIYNRSRINLSKKEGKTVKSSLNKMLDKTIEGKMKEILQWFTKCTHRTKANYTLLLLQMCNPPLLCAASNVIRVLFLREQNIIAEPEKSLPGLKKPFSGKGEMFKAGGAPSSLLLDLDTIRELSSGVSKYRDFIRYLPIHLSKYILSMLDKSTLNRCAYVSQHWATLAHQVKMDLSLHIYIQNEITFLQGSYTKGIDPNYANKLPIPVPKNTEDGKQTRVKNQKVKLRTKNDYSLWTAYQNQETQLVQMEERNVFCGTYNVRVLSEVLDQNRVIHYSGGNLVAIASNRKIQLLDIMQAKEIPIRFRGHAGSIRTIILCEEENFLLSGSYDLSIRYWDLRSGACMRIFNGHQGTITCMDLYKNMLVSGSKDCQVKEWDLETGKCLKTFKHNYPILATKISDTFIVSSCERGIIKVWHLVTAQLVKSLIGHEGAVKCLSFDQWHLLSGSADGLVMAWSMVGKYERCLMAFKHPKEVLHVALHFLRVISACADGKIRIYNFLNGNCLKVMKVNGRGDPVLSFFFHRNRMVINTESNILIFQFETIKWQYPQDRARPRKNKDKEEEKEEIGLNDIPSKSSTQIHSLRDSVSSKQMLMLESSLSKTHRSHMFLRTVRTQSASLMDTAQGKSKSSRRDGKKTNSVWKEISSVDGGQEDLEETSVTGSQTKEEETVDSPEDLILKKKSPQISLTPDQFLLTVNALQQAHNSKELAYPRRPQLQASDVSGPSISYPRKVLSLKGKSVQHEVDQLRASNPPIDVKQISIPLEIQKLQPNLKNSLQSPQVHSTIPQPMIIRSKFSSSLKAEDGTPTSVDGTVRSFKPLTSMQVIKPNRMLAPQVGTASLSVKKERPRFYTAINPLRVNTEFMLLTVREGNEYRETKMKEYQAIKPTGVVSPEKARRAAWIRKIRGLPIDNFMKQGKVAAPELGQNIFI